MSIKSIFRPFVHFLRRLLGHLLSQALEIERTGKDAQPNATQDAQSVNDKLLCDLFEEYRSITYVPPPLVGYRPRVKWVEDVLLVGDPPIALDSAGSFLEAVIFRTPERTSQMLKSARLSAQFRALMDQRSIIGRSEHSQRVNEPVLVLTSPWRNYGHWLTEHFLKVYWVMANGQSRGLRYLLEANPPAWKLQLLGFAGINTSQLIFMPSPRSALRCSWLVVPDFPEVSFEALKWVDSIVPSIASTGYALPRNLFLRRPSSGPRQVVNQAQVEEVLGRFDFAQVEPSVMTVQEQAQIFRNAEVVFGPQGSAFSNMLFCAAGTRIVEAHGPSRIHLFNKQCALVLGHNYDLLLDPRTKQSAKIADEDVEVDLRELYRVLSRVIN